MKIKGLLVLTLLILPFLSAVEFNVNSNYSQGETILTRISGNFLEPITKTDVLFYREHVRIPMEYDITNIQGDYYLYASLVGKQEGSYSISVENAKYMSGTEVITGNLARNFSITNQTAAFSVKPGFVSASGEFFLEVQNLLDKQITISVNTASANTSGRNIIVSDSGNDKFSLSLKSGEIKKIYFELGIGSAALQQVELKAENTNYKVPVYVSASPQYIPPVDSTQKLEPAQLILSIPTIEITKRTIFLYNIGEKEVKNISIELSSEISPFVINFSSGYIETLEGNNNFPIELSFYSLGEIEVEGTLKANVNGEKMIYSNIALKFLNNYVPSNESEQPSVETCAELKGRICTSTESCDSQSVYAKDNVCCLGTCKSTKKDNTGKIMIAIGICVALVALIYWFFKKKFKNAHKPVDLLNIARGKD